ncbi:MAG TPA: beta galactosidase jelly roll domain-containing protein [Edaphobacter sp.]|nr:beta galactosidase jelly roll domain-containing protein [Edaphobacter sp.]
MDRRDFIRSTGSVLVGASLAGAGATLARTGNKSARPSQRQNLPINRGWRFSRTNSTNGHAKDFDDSHFERIAVPHSTVRSPWHFLDEKSYEGTSLYRRSLNIPTNLDGRRVFVDFEGVMTASTVWLNGIRLGEYKGGYTPFSFELTSHVSPGGKNILAVEVDSTERPDIPPFGGEVDY